MGRCARHKLRKGEWTRGNARAKGANWTKFTEIGTKFERNSYEFRTDFTFPEYSHKFIHVKFVRNSYRIRTNFVRISREFRPICQYTKQTHKQAHPALAWAGDAPCPGPRALGRPPRWDRVNQVPCNYEAKRHSPTCFGMQPNHGGCLLCCCTASLGIFSSFLV